MASVSSKARSRAKAAFESLLYKRTVPLLVTIFLAGALLLAWHLSRMTTTLLQSAALQGTSLYSQALEEFRGLYTSEVVARIHDHGIEVTHDYQTKENAIPLPATLTIEFGKRLSQRVEGMEVRLFSEYPFPWRRESGLRDQFDRDALQYLREHPDQPFFRFEQVGGQASLRYAVADRMKARCVGCHNSHPQSPKTDWKEGDVRGVLEVIRPLDALTVQIHRDLGETFLVVLGLGLFGAGGLAVVIRKLHRTSAELEQRVDERTSELTQAKADLIVHYQALQKAQGDLEKHAQDLAYSNAELGQFAYVASHDLQEPLRMISSYTQLLSKRYKGKLDADADEFIAYAVNGAARMQRLINDLLSYSRVGTRGKEFKPTDCEVVLAAALANLKLAIEESQARVSHDPLPTVTADEGQLIQLFQNLIGNAIKFRADQPPTIHLGATKQEAGWLFSVRDEGIGIDPQYKERIFVIFQRLHSQQEYAGTGIGLAICKKIVERHGGRIWVESTLGKGATFYFTMPCKEGHTP